MILNNKDLINIIKECVINIVNESVNSKKLYNIIQQHGGVKSNHGIFDLYNMNDNDIIDVIDWSTWKDICNDKNKLNKLKKDYNVTVRDDIDIIELNDGKYILAVCRGARFDRISPDLNNNREPGDFQDLYKKTSERLKNRRFRRGDYNWKNEKAEDLFKNPWFRNKEGVWSDTNLRKNKIEQARNKKQD